MIPPWAEEAMRGICCPDGDRGLVFEGFGDGLPATRRARGMYGVYVVCGPAAGCLGGGSIGPGRGGGVGGEMGER